MHNLTQQEIKQVSGGRYGEPQQEFGPILCYWATGTAISAGAGLLGGLLDKRISIISMSGPDTGKILSLIGILTGSALWFIGGSFDIGSLETGMIVNSFVGLASHNIGEKGIMNLV